MTYQTEIDFVSRRQNSPANQAILEAKKPELNNQCRCLLAALQKGTKLTVADGIRGIWDFEKRRTIFIGDLRARIRDLRKAGYEIKDEKMRGNYKLYFL